jgi:hypothetical protein
MSREVSQRAVDMFGADATALALHVEQRHTEGELAAELGALGYPGYAHLSGTGRNPAELLFDALDRSDLDVRTIEGLPWVILKYPYLDWAWLIREVKLRNRQNRLGFLVTVSSKLAFRMGRADVHGHLVPVLRELEDARLAKKDTLCQESWPPSRRRHVRSVRSKLAAHWNLDTGLEEGDLVHYAA